MQSTNTRSSLRPTRDPRATQGSQQRLGHTRSVSADSMPRSKQFVFLEETPDDFQRPDSVKKQERMTTIRKKAMNSYFEINGIAPSDRPKNPKSKKSDDSSKLHNVCVAETGTDIDCLSDRILSRFNLAPTKELFIPVLDQTDPEFHNNRMSIQEEIKSHLHPNDDLLRIVSFSDQDFLMLQNTVLTKAQDYKTAMDVYKQIRLSDNQEESSASNTSVPQKSEVSSSLIQQNTDNHTSLKVFTDLTPEEDAFYSSGKSFDMPSGFFSDRIQTQSKDSLDLSGPISAESQAFLDMLSRMPVPSPQSSSNMQNELGNHTGFDLDNFLSLNSDYYTSASGNFAPALNEQYFDQQITTTPAITISSFPEIGNDFSQPKMSGFMSGEQSMNLMPEQQLRTNLPQEFGFNGSYTTDKTQDLLQSPFTSVINTSHNLSVSAPSTPCVMSEPQQRRPFPSRIEKSKPKPNRQRAVSDSTIPRSLFSNLDMGPRRLMTPSEVKNPSNNTNS